MSVILVCDRCQNMVTETECTAEGKVRRHLGCSGLVRENHARPLEPTRPLGAHYVPLLPIRGPNSPTIGATVLGDDRERERR